MNTPEAKNIFKIFLICLLLLGLMFQFGPIRIIPFVKERVKELVCGADIQRLEDANSELSSQLYALQNNPILMPDSAGKYLIIFNKEILKNTGIKQVQTDKNPPVRLALWQEGFEGKEFVEVHTDQGGYFAFSLTSEQLKRPFQVEILLGETWLPLNLTPGEKHFSIKLAE